MATEVTVKNKGKDFLNIHIVGLNHGSTKILGVGEEATFTIPNYGHVELKEQIFVHAGNQDNDHHRN